MTAGTHHTQDAAENEEDDGDDAEDDAEPQQQDGVPVVRRRLGVVDSLGDVQPDDDGRRRNENDETAADAEQVAHGCQPRWTRYPLQAQCTIRT